MADALFTYNIYGDLLHTPGYTVDFAIVTTYSLDLEALVGVPLSFGMLGDMDDSFMNSPLYLLESIRKSSDKIAIFCNSAGISVPKDQQLVYSLLEDSIFEVKQKGSFHPKLWVIKEHNEEGDVRIKVIVSSLNLTFDHSIDMVVSLCGKLTRKPTNKNLPLIEFIQGFASLASVDKKKQIHSLCGDLRYVIFEVEHPFENEYEFMPINPIYGNSLDQIKYELNGNDIFVVSPFVDEATINWISNGRRNREQGDKVDKELTKRNNLTLVTRRPYITQNILDSIDSVYAVNEELLEDPDNVLDIHAKLYFIHKTDGWNHLYIGSANATNAAFTKNTELLLKLTFARNQASFSKFSNEFLGESENKYVQISSPTFDSSCVEGSNDERILKEAVRSLKKAMVTEEGDTYSITITYKQPYDNVSISPMQVPSIKRSLTGDVKFTGILLKQLSSFYIVTVGDIKRVVKIQTSGIPDNRDEFIFKSVVDTREKFIDYVSFMISDSPQEYIYDHERLIRELKDGKPNGSRYIYSTLYEDMLKLAYVAPHRLCDIDKLIEKVDRKVIPQEFYQMYQQFKQTLKLM